jgi:hypothetical protein
MSMTALSVSITARMSPLRIWSPSCLTPLAKDSSCHGVRQPGHEHLRHGLSYRANRVASRVSRMTRVSAPAPGKAASFSGSAYGSGTSATATRRTGASR